MSTTPGPVPTPYFGRVWNIRLATQGGGTFGITNLVDNTVFESLRVTFTIEALMNFSYLLPAYFQATVTIYNLSVGVATQVLKSSPSLANPWNFQEPLNTGDILTISAGYQYSSSGTFNSQADRLFQGRILQSIWTRENVTDYKLTIRAVYDDAYNFLTRSVAPGASAYDVVNEICANSTVPLTLENGAIDDDAKAVLQASRTPGSQALHGRPFGLLANIASQNNLFFWASPDGINIRKFGPDTQPQAANYAYGPPNLPHITVPIETKSGTVKRTLIGVPEQTQDGVTFRVLMDSTPKIGDVVQLAPGTLINPALLNIGTLPPIPSQTGQYVVNGLRHVGDSRGRGNDWYTEIHGLVLDFFSQFGKSRTPTPGN